MKMTKFEKRLVNRRNKAENNIKKVEKTIMKVEMDKVKDVLEIGCGIGLVSAYFATKYDVNVYGTDFDPEEIHLAKKCNNDITNLHFQQEDASHLSFADNSFDLVISQNVFHHIPDWQSAVKEIFRVLNSGGYLIWNDLVFANMIKKLFQPITKNYGLYTFKDVLGEFNEKNFKIISQENYLHGPFKHYELIITKN